MGRDDLLVRTPTTESQMEHANIYITGLRSHAQILSLPTTTTSSSTTRSMLGTYFPALVHTHPKM